MGAAARGIEATRREKKRRGASGSRSSWWYAPRQQRATVRAHVGSARDYWAGLVAVGVAALGTDQLGGFSTLIVVAIIK